MIFGIEDAAWLLHFISMGTGVVIIHVERIIFIPSHEQ